MAGGNSLGVEVQLVDVDAAANTSAHIRLRYGTGVYDSLGLTPIAAEQLAGALLDAAKRVRTARAAINGSRSSTPKASS